MLLDLYFHHQNSAPRSGVNRLWLIEYYTKAFTEKDKAEKQAAKLAGQVVARQNKARRAKAIEAAAVKAEQDLEALAQGTKDLVAAQQFTQALLRQAQAMPVLEVDFMVIAARIRLRIQQEDGDLLLLAMVI